MTATIKAIAEMTVLSVAAIFLKELSMFGFDNYDLISIVKPKLCLMIQPIQTIAQEGTRLLMERIKKDSQGSYESIVLKAEMSLGLDKTHLRISLRGFFGPKS